MTLWFDRFTASTSAYFVPNSGAMSNSADIDPYKVSQSLGPVRLEHFYQKAACMPTYLGDCTSV
jgi:hypothetical protein